MQHFAFGDITDDYEIDVSGLQDVFDEFKGLNDVKRIMTFGGWSFSTEYDTAPIFREGVTTEQRHKFADNVVKVYAPRLVCLSDLLTQFSSSKMKALMASTLTGSTQVISL